ncbi:alpha/beta fold hydrolase [Actinomadura verrucosospora]|uniref:1H-3-hydroxy-4-oxoquinaldine 2,4-dioxygenase MeqE n=1 Tax=Actinomadura verrucosospora TaxID=46165 RepID=A0A7D3VW98_ACTVE|nr:alpha/beta hydrolase [Actinomadura verrucosospora]QKG24399.1 1H-3-hydroxy-4-oxoquinaldine 2,4-dioxygenase MeqE [Actinomadura verrucosospora]
MTDLKTLRIGGNPITYQDLGPRDAPAVVLMSGWCHDHRLFDRLVPHLAGDLRVLCIDWRGHGEDRTPVADFGYREQASDTIAVLDELGVGRFLPLSHSHGGWANLEIAERVGAARAPRLIVVDWLMTPPAPEFAAGLAAIQDPATWIEGRQGLYDVWLNGQDHERVKRHLDEEMSGFDFEMWARSCRVIAEAYAEFGSPLDRMVGLTERRPVTHLFSQPTDPAYEQAQIDFRAGHPWFGYRTLGGPTHFPTLDVPDKVAAEIRDQLG